MRYRRNATPLFLFIISMYGVERVPFSQKCKSALFGKISMPFGNEFQSHPVKMFFSKINLVNSPFTLWNVILSRGQRRSVGLFWQWSHTWNTLVLFIFCPSVCPALGL
jgi:hypothetical protein